MRPCPLAAPGDVLGYVTPVSEREPWFPPLTTPLFFLLCGGSSIFPVLRPQPSSRPPSIHQELPSALPADGPRTPGPAGLTSSAARSLPRPHPPPPRLPLPTPSVLMLSGAFPCCSGHSPPPLKTPQRLPPISSRVETKALKTATGSRGCDRAQRLGGVHTADTRFAQPGGWSPRRWRWWAASL